MEATFRFFYPRINEFINFKATLSKEIKNFQIMKLDDDLAKALFARYRKVNLLNIPIFKRKIDELRKLGYQELAITTDGMELLGFRLSAENEWEFFNNVSSIENDLSVAHREVHYGQWASSLDQTYIDYIAHLNNTRVPEKFKIYLRGERYYIEFFGAEIECEKVS